MSKNINSGHNLKWEVLEADVDSDHRPMLISLEIDMEVRVNRRYKTKFCKQSKFKKAIKKKLVKYNKELKKLGKDAEKEVIEKSTIELITIIQETAEETLKRKQVGRKPNFVWWSESLRKQRNKITAMLRLGKKKSGEEKTALLLGIKRERAKYRKLILGSKRTAWINFCSTNSENKYGMLYKMAHDKVFKPTQVSVDWKNNRPMGEDENLEKLTKVMFKSCKFMPNAEPHEDASKEFFPFTTTEISKALKLLDPNKAPGSDNIDLRMLRMLNETNRATLKNWSNLCQANGYFPEVLKAGQVVYFLKPGKSEEEVTSYRPICLLSALGKLLEKLVQRRLVFFLEKEKKISQFQFGFRENRSSTEAISWLLNEIVTNLKEKKYVTAVMVDIQGAFDAVKWDLVTKRLRDLKCPKALHLILASYLEKRSVIIDWGSGNKHVSIEQGCPQGSCLGPILWTLVINKLLETFPYAENNKIIAFADDVVILGIGRHRRAIERNIREGLSALENWLTEYNLKISKNKTVSVTFHKWLKPLKRRPTLKIQNNSIKSEFAAKYLGIKLTADLTWHAHIKEKKEQLNKIVQQYHRMTRNKWGIKSNLIKIWYETVVEKKLLYAAGAWGELITTKDESEKLVSAQRPFLLKVARSYKSVSTQALQVLTGIIPADIKLRNLAKEEKVLRLKQNVTIGDKLVEHKKVETKKENLFMEPSKECCLKIGVIEEKEYVGKSENWEIYTDGSKQEEGTGAAMLVKKGVTVKHSVKWKLNNYNTVYQAEAWALLQAVRYINEKELTNVKVLSDSLSVLSALNKTRQRNPIIQNIISMLVENKNKGLATELTWVKAHIGVKGNEEVDKLAKEAAQQLNQDLQTSVTKDLKIPISHIKGSIKQQMMREWQERWNESIKGRCTHDLLPSVQNKILLCEQWVMGRLTEHGPTPAYLYKKKITDSDQCICGQKGTVQHYFENCSLTAKWHFQKLTPSNCEVWLKSLMKSKNLRKKGRELWDWLQYNAKDITHA